MALRPSERGTGRHDIRIDDQFWAELGKGAELLGTDRSDIIREGARRELNRRLRKHARDQAQRSE